ncbi:MAG TPA: beta-propeller domain-containing protein [Acidimicrobiales bacterium]|nr:beta-propeller domain-containing protein [Acidimicrobiales bacterium]
MKDRDLEGRLERLATRGSPRGADTVLEAAQARAAGPPATVTTLRRLTPAIAVAAAVSLIGGVAIARSRDNGPQIASHPLSTVPGATTTTGPPEVSIPTALIAQSRLLPFSNCGALTSYMKTKALQTVSAYGLPGAGGGMYVAAGGVRSSAGAAESKDSATAAAAPTAAPASSSLATTDNGFSMTNVQEAGIDEPDIVKTNGNYIYATNNGDLFIVSATQPKIVGSLKFGNVNDLFLVGDRVIVFSNGGGGYAMDDRAVASSKVAGPNAYNPQARITVVDVSNPASPKEVSHVDIDGQYISARLVDGVARVVLSSVPSRVGFVYPVDGTPAATTAAFEKNKQTIQATTAADWLPHMTVTSNGKTSTDRTAVACDDAYRPPQFSGFSMLSVLTIDPKNPAAAKSTSVAADGQIVYGSATRLYIATTQWGQVQPMAGGASQIMAPTNPKTLIHDFDISDPGQARYRVSGSVRGTVLNQFSMSEHDGNLRVATTDGDESFVTVLADQSKILGQIGQVGGLGKGERIYAVRFIGPLGYVVTFRQVDPLYVVDLHDPTKPRVVGELKILGYSAYLHPVSDTLLIGVGQDATEEGRRAGTQVSLFDVSNPAAPKLLQKHALGQNTNSQAEYDHHAFLYWAPKQLAVIPLQEYGQQGPGFSGAIGMHVVPTEIREVGRVAAPAQYYGISRSLVIGGQLFTISQGGIKASTLDTFAERAFVAFPQQQPQPYDGGGGVSPGSPGQTEPSPPSADGGAAR